MLAASRSLRVFIARRPGVLASQPPTSSPTQLSGPSSPLTSAWHVLQSIWATGPGEKNRQEIICTAYGLVLTQSAERDCPTPYELALLPASEPTTAATAANGGPTHTEHHYRIFPDWGTSFFWKDPNFADTEPGDSAVEDEVIESRYPTLAPCFTAWREIYEDAFEEQECNLGSGKEVFPNVELRVAWYTEGFLMACWLVLQPGVDSVEFASVGKTYRLDKASVGEKLKEFLDETDALLGEEQ